MTGHMRPPWMVLVEGTKPNNTLLSNAILMVKPPFEHIPELVYETPRFHLPSKFYSLTQHPTLNTTIAVYYPPRNHAHDAHIRRYFKHYSSNSRLLRCCGCHACSSSGTTVYLMGRWPLQIRWPVSLRVRHSICHLRYKLDWNPPIPRYRRHPLPG